MVSAAVVGLTLLGISTDTRADEPGRLGSTTNPPATLAPGSIQGVVQDENGAPVDGAVVSALGKTTVYAVTDRSGRFELRALSPGSYLLRAHSSGFNPSHSQTIEVRPSSRNSSSIGLRRATLASAAETKAGTRLPPALLSPRSSSPAHVAVPVPTTITPPTPILRAGLGLPAVSAEVPAARPVPPADEPAPAGVDTTSPSDDDHRELAWHLRHLRRSVLQEATGEVFDPGDSLVKLDGISAAERFSRTDGSPLRLAANLFAGAPFTGELNLLTTTSFDTPQQLFNGDMFARNVAYVSVGAPAGSNADWAVRGALSQADISAWVIAGTYSSRSSSRHQYDVGLSYATQRYDGGNPAALRDVTDGSRNAGAIYGFDTWTLAPALAITYGARYARYDYLENKDLISPRVSLTLSAGDHFRVGTSASRRSIAPGAEEFLPPGESGIWLPPQRTFSSLISDGSLDAEHTTHLEVNLERDLGPTSTVTLRAFQQFVADQLVTMFGVDAPGVPPANLGHYFVGNYGDVDARGIAAGLRTVAGRVRGSIDYSMTRAEWSRGDDLAYQVLRMPDMPFRPDRLHSLSTSIQTDVPETSTRVVVLYRISNASSARRRAADDRTVDSRFDIEVHQSLPFMDFSTAKWEMLIGVRNFFRETAADQSVFDELLVVRPPKRIVGGLTMRF